MGRATASYRIAIDAEIVKWNPFRDALGKPETEIFENMLLRSKLYASAGCMAVRSGVLESMFMSILLDHHIRFLELATEIEKIRSPEKAKELKGIEKFLQSPVKDRKAWQTKIGPIRSPGSS